MWYFLLVTWITDLPTNITERCAQVGWDFKFIVVNFLKS